MTARPGYFIWRLVSKISKLYTSQQLADLLLKYGVSWVSIKVADGSWPMNQPKPGDDSLLFDYISTLQSAGIEVGGWAYAYPSKPYRVGARTSDPVQEAAFYGRRIRELELQHFMIDAETEWKQAGLAKEIQQLCNIDILPGYPIGLCSYRYPHLHRLMDWRTWMAQPHLTYNAPQVYWVGMHDPVRQLEWCFAEYIRMSDKPFVPIGAMYKAGQWSPTVADIREFVIHCQVRGWNQYGFWSLDDALAHPEWMEAANG